MKEIQKQAVQVQMEVTQNCRELRLLSICQHRLPDSCHLMVEDGGSELQPLCLHSRPQRGRREKSVNSLLLKSKRQNLDTQPRPTSKDPNLKDPSYIYIVVTVLCVCVVLSPGGSAGKESACNTGDLGLIPGLGRSPGGGTGYPLQYSGLENSMD